jgi:hypothetical protein
MIAAASNQQNVQQASLEETRLLMQQLSNKFHPQGDIGSLKSCIKVQFGDEQGDKY